MIINRHNYEEYFLLYVDNELSAAVKLEVENFVNDNEDVTKEFYALKESVLIPGNDKFLPKANLYKTSANISLVNCEEYFLLHVDGELNEAEQHAVEKFVLQNPETQTNFTLIHQTKLTADPVAFPNKELLYKKPVNKIVWMSWSRMAIAAMFAGVAVALYFLIPSDRVNRLQASNQQQTLKTNKTNAPGLAASSKPAKNNNTTALTGQTSSKIANEQVITARSARKNATKVVRPVTNPKDRNNQEDVSKAPVDKPRNIDLSLSEKNIIPVAENLAAEITPQLVRNNVVAEGREAVGEKKDLVQQTVYKEIDTDADERENSFLFGSTRINKNKLRGLLKKASGLFDKKADKADTEKTIQIASFEIKGK